MERFYQLTPSKDRICEVRRILGNPSGDVGPVHTNYPAKNAMPPRLIIIGESPSREEVEAGFPMVGRTGLRTFHCLIEACMIDGRQRPHLGDFHDQHYASLARESRIYITNLVRYQADHGLQNLDPRVRLSSKNARVKKLWRSTRDELFRELTTIMERFGRCSVLVAPGTAFLAEVKELAAELDNLDMKWYITNHPSRTPAVYYAHYNPNNWNREEVPRCKMMDRVTAFMKRRQ